MSALINSFTLTSTSFSLPTKLAFNVNMISANVFWNMKIDKEFVYKKIRDKGAGGVKI